MTYPWKYTFLPVERCIKTFSRPMGVLWRLRLCQPVGVVNIWASLEESSQVPHCHTGGWHRLKSEQQDRGGFSGTVFPVIIILSKQLAENLQTLWDACVQRKKSNHVEQGLAFLYRCQIVLTAQHLFVPFVFLTSYPLSELPASSQYLFTSIFCFAFTRPIFQSYQWRAYLSSSVCQKFLLK